MSPLAYSLSQEGEAWRWRLYDEDGVTVAEGRRSSRTAALADVEIRLKAAATEEAA